jgi:ribose 5-phosphate isomerase B
MKIGIGSDHAGYQYKEAVKTYLKKQGHDVTDFGTHSEEPCDYPVFCRPLARAVASGELERGIILGGSGNGEAMTANRVAGVRCALCWNEYTARMARAHNNANMLALGERTISLKEALTMVEIWLKTDFEGGRHERRIKLIDRPGS